MSRFKSDDGAGYTWEQAYEKTWDALGIDTDSFFETSEIRERILSRRRRNRAEEKVHRGMMRNVVVIFDLSDAMSVADLKPTRLECSTKYVAKFIAEYFDHNPVSQLGLVVTKDGRADRLTDLCSGVQRHTDALKLAATYKNLGGEPSFQNALELARRTLRGLPPHASREVIMITSSLTSCDPGNIHDTINSLVTDKLKVSIIGLAASLNVCDTITKATGGSYNIILDEVHLMEILIANVPPPPAPVDMEAALMLMGFPNKQDSRRLAACACHAKKVEGGGYICPRCSSKHCEVPTECLVCGLMLVSSAHIARSYSHLFPPPSFEGKHISSIDNKSTDLARCDGCHCRHVPKSGVSACPECKQQFCIECEIFVHEVLHSCPGCCSLQEKTISRRYDSMIAE
eukprot:CFRG5459T1